MSEALQDSWSAGPSGESATPARSNNSAIVHLLEQRDSALVGHGVLNDGSLTERDTDRARICKYLIQHPEGVLRTFLVHEAVKGHDTFDGNPFQVGFHDVDANALDRHTTKLDEMSDKSGELGYDGTDPDYQFTYNFTQKLQDAGLVQLTNTNAGTEVRNLLPLVDLISEGISKTASESDELLYDRQFAKTILKSCRSKLKQLSDGHKNQLHKSLRRYIRRVQDYRLVFDVTFLGRDGGGDTQRMTKPYKTRFTSRDRQNRAFARLQASLEYGYDRHDSAVFVTLTTDPKRFDSLYDAIDSINENWNRLTSWMQSDPETARDTRKPEVPAWKPELDTSNYNYFPDGEPSGGPPEGPVTSRPRELLEFIKVLEFSSNGYPHIHALLFDPPRRESDGMPWLVQKSELINRWEQVGQGTIVDTWPLVYRDDLDDIDRAVFNADEGFVSWYRYGEHDHSEEWVENQSRCSRDSDDAHTMIDMDGDEADAQEKTAGAYMGKYISETYDTLLDREKEAVGQDVDHEKQQADWKLAMYWASGRQFWSVSHGIRDAIRPDEEPLPDEVQEVIQSCVETSVKYHVGHAHDGHALYPDLEDTNSESVIEREIQGPLAFVDYLGAFAVWDLPTRNLGGQSFEAVEKAVADGGTEVSLAASGDKPPPLQAALN